MSLLANSNAIEDAGYKIQRSLRFRSSASAYLSRTPASSGNQKTFTFSAWIKRGAITGDNTFFCARQLSTSTPYFFLGFDNSTNILSLNSNNGTLYTTAVYRDPSAWYHIIYAVDTTQATPSNRIKLYVNGIQVTAFGTATYPSLNADMGVNSTIAHWVGVVTNGIGSLSQYFDGYLSEVNFIDGQALTPSSFGQTDPVTGVWTPKKYTGTYGTNGFYLPFSDNTSATTLAYDKSGNSNNWTPNNISTTAGATYDSMTDVPTLTSASAANYCVFNPLWQGRTNAPTNGNLDYPASSVGIGTMDVSLFSSYWEITSAGGTTTASVYSTSAATTVSVTTGLTYGFRFNSSTGALDYTTNGSSFTSLATGLTSGPYFVYVSTAAATTASFNGGQRPFSYTPPTGFKALNTFNLPDPTIKKPNQYMDATLYTGNGSTQTVTNAAGFAPDFVWIKTRSAAYDHAIFDTSRGATNMLASNTNNAEAATSGSLTSFNSNGFSVGSYANVNNNATNIVGWQWKKGATPGLDIVVYTGNGSTQNISHSLGVTPAMMIVKGKSSATNWAVWNKAFTAGQYIELGNANGVGSSSTLWNNTLPTSTVFSVGANGWSNTNAATYVAYLFAEIAGFSKFGTYTGNGSTDGPFCYTGFRPKYVCCKVTSSGGAYWDWFQLDSARDTYNVMSHAFLYNTNSDENVATSSTVDFLSNGFKIRNTTNGYNSNGQSYIFLAFAENPFKYSLAR